MAVEEAARDTHRDLVRIAHPVGTNIAVVAEQFHGHEIR